MRGGYRIAACVANPPNPAAGAVSTRVVEGHLVVANNAVVEVGDVEGAIRAHAEIDRAKPGICSSQKVRLLDGADRGGSMVESVAVHTAGHHVATETAATIGLGKTEIVINRDATDRG